jgi:hypothetical protein
VRLAAQRHRRSLFEGHLVRQAVETGAYPVDVSVQERSGFIEIALQRERHDDRAACAADAKRQTSGTGVAAHFKLCANVLEMNGSRFRWWFYSATSIHDAHALCPQKLLRTDMMQQARTRVSNQCSTKMTYQGSRRRSSDNVVRRPQRM